jgi:signal transduction histidine kinase
VFRNQTFAAEKNIRVDYDIPEHSIQVDRDTHALRRLFVILIDNAVKYSNPGGNIRITARQPIESRSRL